MIMKAPKSKLSLTTSLLILTSAVAVFSFSACYQIGDVVNEAATEATQQHPIRTPKQTSKLNAYENSTYQTATDELLKAYNWTLVSAEVQGAPIHSYEKIIEDRAGSLIFSNRGAYFTVGCNHNFQNYQLSEGRLSVSQRVSTLMACHSSSDDLPNLAQIESKLAQDLNDSTLKIKTNPDDYTATLLLQKGAQVLSWQGDMKPEVRFGEPVLLFWEIEPEKINCVDESGKERQCLKVRNVTYNEQGIKTGSGAWRTFYGEIHGYEYQPNLRQIVRLNAYNNPKSKENPYYIYDRSVEIHYLDIPVSQ
ncbi:META domain [Moraxella veridica]|nr:META domain [Moraxella catarrhalis]